MKYLTLLLTVACFKCIAQETVSKKVNTSSAEAYLQIAKQIKADGSPNDMQWKTLFSSPACQMMIMGGALDTAALKTEMLQVFNSTYKNNNTAKDEHQAYLDEYSNNLSNLEKYITRLNSVNVEDSVKQLLYPYLPVRLQSAALFPTLFYLHYGSAEATGNSGLVFNDLLLSYKIDQYKFGLLTAHEAFHAVVSMAFMQHLKPNTDFNAPDFNLLYVMENINEEGIADLVDKPLLEQKKSPLYETVQKLRSNDTILSIQYIRKIDSLLSACNSSDDLLKTYPSFNELASQLGMNGGHIPGRFMALVIRNAGLLKEQIENVEDPVSFFITYNKAAHSLKNKIYPTLSDASLAYLQKLKIKFFKE